MEILTHADKWTDDIDLSLEYGYKHIWKRLKEYEDTELSPKEILNLKNIIVSLENKIYNLKAENENIRQEHIHNSIYAELVEENKQLKKRLENAVELPCKVNADTVYTFSYGNILECYIDKFTVVYENGRNVVYAVLSAKHKKYCGMLYRFVTVNISEFGKTVFLTREEAQRIVRMER